MQSPNPTPQTEAAQKPAPELTIPTDQGCASIVSVTDSYDFVNPWTTYEDGCPLPVVFIHGLNARDKSLSESEVWGRTPSYLRARGYSVWFTNHDSWNDVEHNAIQIAAALLEIAKITGAPKLHVIAHSKGGLDARRAFSYPGVAPLIASFTTMASPINGTRFATLLSKIPHLIKYLVAPILNLYGRIQGDPHPDTYKMMWDLTIKGSQKILAENPDIPGVEYRSFVFVAERPRFHLQNPASLIMQLVDGRTDGVVPYWSAERPGIQRVRVKGVQKVTHDEIVDMHRRDILHILPNGAIYGSAPQFIYGLLKELEKGYRARLAQEEADARADEGEAERAEAGDAADES